MIAGTRLLLVLAYLGLAGQAGARQSPLLAAFALGDLALLVLLDPLLRRRVWAWGMLIAVVAGLFALARTRFVLAPLLLVPPAVSAWIAWWFARSLIAPRVPLITRIAAAVHGQTPETLDPAQRDYARRVTLGWALLLATMAGVNLCLAALAVPNGLLAQVGLASPWPLTQTQWGRWSALATYAPLVGFMGIEYFIRRRRFHDLPYRHFFDFVMRMAALGPGFWRGLFRA